MANFQMIHSPISGIVVDDSACELDDLASCGGIQVTVPAGESWDALAERAVTSEWVGVEALSWIDGTVGDAVRINAAAHGQAVSDTVVSVRTWDRLTDAQKTFPLADCALGTDTSRFLEVLPDASDRFEILDVSFLFRQGDLSAPIRDADLAATLGIQMGARVPLGAVREAVRR
ncbi:FAD-binding protein [Tessaracoccus antarcticus]|uniref:FAD-binding protein n=1 Tax=Tessaracoccus antarcticus TaxID=2479848 RepID=A0A3M0G6Y0_9ACTN|nr:FAD-binding protein [Tessaracoccus antarcticus]RMB59877.1 FAD-binding protein [Tessaracoccus antarcticus]